MHRFGFALVSVIAVSFAGCKPDAGEPSNADSKPEAKPEPPAELPEPKMLASAGQDPLPKPELDVELPPTPTDVFEGPEVPAQYDDGAFSVAGLRAHLDAQIEQGEAGVAVRVRAYVQRIVMPTCTGSDGCGLRHFWVADGPEVTGRRLALLVGPYAYNLSEDEAEHWKHEPIIIVEAGKQYLFKGNFLRTSDVGFSDPRGVLQLHAVETKAGEWVYPPGSPWHPKTEAFQPRAPRAASTMASSRRLAKLRIDVR